MMNTKRVAGWVAFFGVAAAVTWLPAYFTPMEGSDAFDVSVAMPASTLRRSTVSSAETAATPALVRDLSPAGDLFAARSWKAAPTLAVVNEQPVNVTPTVQAPVAPPLPFQFIGKLDDRSDLQIFLQNGEKIYVVRKGDVIDDMWRIEAISEVELSLVYLPLHLSQTLSVGSTQ